MSLNYEDKGKMVANISNKVLYLSDKAVEDGFLEYTSKGDHSFQHIPDKQTERSVLYITGQSGSGKSYYTKNYVIEYHKMYPKRDVFIFSSLDDDVTLDKLKYLKRIKIKSDSFLNAELSTADFRDSLCIFDDVDVISNKIVKKAVFNLLNNILETGRHTNTSVIYTSHNATAGLDTKKILNECHSVTIFPRNLGGKMSKYLLDQYIGLDKVQIKKLKNIKSRWVTIFKTYPQFILSDKSAYILNE